MVFYKECEEEEFKEIRERVLNDDALLKEHLQTLEHKQLNFTILNLGNLLQICAIYFDLKKDNIESNLKLEKDQLKNKRMKNIVEELNKTINLRYEFDEKTEVIEGLFTFDNEGYIFINKMLFVRELTYKDEYPNI